MPSVDTASEEPILVDRDGAVAVVTLNRPHRANALTAEAGAMFESRMAELGTDESVRVIVLTGAGDKAFCAGADVERLDGIAGDSDPRARIRKPGSPGPLDAIADAPPLARARYSAPIAVPQPVIGAINGACAGVGFSLACSCDIRFASSNAVFTAAFGRRGLIAESAIAWTLPRIVGHGLASDILLSARKVDAEEALRIGLVGRVHTSAALLDETIAYAREIAASVSPRSTRIIKRQLRLGWEQDHGEAMLTGYEETVAAVGSDDFREGIASFKDRRPPQFSGS